MKNINFRKPEMRDRRKRKTLKILCKKLSANTKEKKFL